MSHSFQYVSSDLEYGNAQGHKLPKYCSSMDTKFCSDNQKYHSAALNISYHFICLANECVFRPSYDLINPLSTVAG